MNAMDFETLRVRQGGAVLFAEIAAPPMNLLGTQLVPQLPARLRRAVRPWLQTRVNGRLVDERSI
jgi:hypothetical protein